MSLLGNRYIQVAAAVAVAYVGYRVIKRRSSGGSSGSVAGDIGAEIGGAIVDGAGGAAVGIVEGIGDAIGLPRTDINACQAAMNAGDVIEASLVCPAPDFLKWASLGFPVTNFKGG